MTNEMPEFVKDIDNEAIASRLEVFKCDLLPKKDKKVTRKHYCFMFHLFGVENENTLIYVQMQSFINYF